jgi:hypothetical protein
MCAVKLALIPVVRLYLFALTSVCLFRDTILLDCVTGLDLFISWDLLDGLEAEPVEKFWLGAGSDSIYD